MDPASLRTLTNSHGVTALPLFSSERQLEDAAARYGWLGHDAQVPKRLLSITDGIRVAKVSHANVLVLDIAADHAFELDEGEMELLSTSTSRPPSYGALTVVSSRATPLEGVEVKRVSTRPPGFSADGYERPTPDPSRSVLKPSSITPDPHTRSVSATFGASPTATMEALEELPSERLFDAFTEVLREYPEVEWACVVRADRGVGTPNPSVALRVEPAFRKHLAEIGEKLRGVGGDHGRLFEVLVLDTHEQMKMARSVGMPFYPWRRDSKRK